MAWAFKMFFKLIGKLFIFCFSLPFVVIALPFYLPYYFIKESKAKKSGLRSVTFTPMPKFSKNMTGLDYEVYCAKRLSREGYRNLAVTRGSGDFGADVVGYDRKGNKVCFQCKMYRNPVGVSTVQEVLGSLAYYKASKAVVITTSTFTPAARKLAKSGGVNLIERYYEKGMDKLDWIDNIELYDAAIE